MTPERWQEVKEMIRRQYSVEYEETEEIEGEPGNAEVLEFEGPSGLMRLEYVTKPRRTGRRVHSAGRPGSISHEEVLYSTTENTQYLQVFLWNDDDERWVEVDQAKMSGAL